MADLVNNPKSAGGSALIIDYGDDRVFGGSLRVISDRYSKFDCWTLMEVVTFQAFKKHKIVDMFETPGQCDLTANVDFAYLKEAMRDAGK